MNIPASDITRVIFRYDSGGIPPPFSHTYTIEVQCSNELLIDIDMKYTGREELTDQEVYDEGFSHDDDFNWSGTLPHIWRQVLLQKLDRSAIGKKPPAATPNDARLEVQMISDRHQTVRGYPGDLTNWHKFLQEIIQAGLELAGRERPLIIKYLSNEEKPIVEKKITLAFAYRSMDVVYTGDHSTYEWKRAADLIRNVYALDYDLDKGKRKRPRLPGRFIDIGDGIWYNLDRNVHSPTQRKDLVALLVDQLEAL